MSKEALWYRPVKRGSLFRSIPKRHLMYVKRGSLFSSIPKRHLMSEEALWYRPVKSPNVKRKEALLYLGWLWSVGSIKLKVSFAKEPYKRDDILQKRPIV